MVRSGHCHLALAMDCENPFGFTLWSRGGISLETGRRIAPVTVTGQSRCRKCEPCKLRKSRMWQARAIDEWSRWPVTVFGTFTLSMSNHLLLDVRAREYLREQGKNFDLISDQERFSARAREFGREVTKWLKRVRNGPDGKGLSLRFLLVAEVHDSESTSDGMRGRPHFHMLLHDRTGSAFKGSPRIALENEGDGDWEVRKIRVKSLDGELGWRPAVFLRDEAFIRKNWTLGFTKFQWAEDHKSAYYVCKYLSKSILSTRVRCSGKYGRLEPCESLPTRDPRSRGASAATRASLTPHRSEVLEGGLGGT